METTTAGAEARQLLLRHYQGILSTLSVAVGGYPFGSVVPYCLDRQGRPIILISRIAQHTKNVLADPKVSLIAIERGVDDIQTAGRLTLLADAARIPPEDEGTPERYYCYFPQSRDYHKTHDFDFHRLEPVRARYIGGFGDICWLEPEQLLLPNPFTGDLLRKMNAYWRAANYLSVGQIYLYDNPLMKDPLKLEHVKPRLLGHWGTTPVPRETGPWGKVTAWSDGGRRR